MKENNTIQISRIWLLIFPLVVLIWASLGYFLPAFLPDPNKYKQMFEAINALFAGLAFAGIILTILHQRADLKLQRHELELTRQELQGQKEQLKSQNDTLTLQTFQNTFFQLLRLHQDLVNSIDVSPQDERPPLKGRDAFKYIFSDLEVSYDTRKSADLEKNVRSPEEQLINRAYIANFDEYQSKTGHYFRNLYNT